MSDRTVAITFPPGEPEDPIQIRVHVDGVHHGEGRESMGVGWEYLPTAQEGRTRIYASFWELLTSLRSLRPGRVRPGLKVSIEAGDRRAALSAFAERGYPAAGWSTWLAGRTALSVNDGRSCRRPTERWRAMPEGDRPALHARLAWPGPLTIAISG